MLRQADVLGLNVCFLYVLQSWSKLDFIYITLKFTKGGSLIGMLSLAYQYTPHVTHLTLSCAAVVAPSCRGTTDVSRNEREGERWRCVK